MKHVGKMKDNNAKVVVVYRTLPGDPYNALVVSSSQLGSTYHNSLMDLIQEPSGQSANELADILSVRKFPDGSNMLVWLHTNGFLLKVPTDSVIMTPTPQATLALDELNKLIAEQKGSRLEELSVKDTTANSLIAQKKAATVAAPVLPPTAAELRSKADNLFKEAQTLRRQADELDPPTKKVKAAKAEA